MVSTSSFSKQVIAFFLVTALIIRPTFASAVGGWTMGNPVAQGASVVYDGTKKVIIDGKDYIKKGTAVITPTATGVAKTLAKGVAGVALSVAVEQLLGAVDWVLDPANNRITYVDPNVKTPADSACKAKALSIYGASNPWTSKAVYKDGYCVLSDDPYFKLFPAPNSDTTIPEDQRKSLPLTTVVQKVISNAESGDTNAQVATAAAAADIVAEAEKDNVKARPIAQQLEASSTTKPSDEAAAENANTATGEQTQNPTKPDTTDLKLEFPAFCGWAPTVCEAAQTVISFPQTLIGWWETATTSISEAWTKVKEEYADKPEENTDTELDIPDLSDESIDTDISFGGSCPSPLSTPYSFAGVSGSMEFSFQPLCDIASFIKPVVISVSAFAAALIVAGIRTEDD